MGEEAINDELLLGVGGRWRPSDQRPDQQRDEQR